MFICFLQIRVRLNPTNK